MKLIISFAVPLLFGFLFQQFYNLVDTMIVGRFLGVDDLAAVGSTVRGYDRGDGNSVPEYSGLDEDTGEYY